LGGRQFLGPRPSAFGSPELSEGSGGRILPGIRIFQWRAVHVLSNGLLDHPAGGGREVPILWFA
jgi:hypothetical protein